MSEDTSVPQALNFRARDWFRITGRGWAASFDAADLVANDLYDPSQVALGQQITIDGDPYEVRGVETHPIPRGAGQPYRLGFSFLVRGERPADWPARREAVIEPLPVEPERPAPEGTFPAIWVRPSTDLRGEIDVYEALR